MRKILLILSLIMLSNLRLVAQREDDLAPVNDVLINILESSPPQYTLVVEGDLPDGCTEIEGHTQQVLGLNIIITLTTTSDSEMMCTMALVPFTHEIRIDTAGLMSAEYTITVNGVQLSSGNVFIEGIPNAQAVDEGTLAPVDSVTVNVMESAPVQVELVVEGELSDSCTEISEHTQNVDGNIIEIELFTMRDPNAICAQVLTPYSHTVQLDMQGLTPASYALIVNGVDADFTLSATDTASDDEIDVDAEAVPVGECPTANDETRLFQHELQGYCLLVPSDATAFVFGDRLVLQPPEVGRVADFLMMLSPVEREDVNIELSEDTAEQVGAISVWELNANNHIIENEDGALYRLFRLILNDDSESLADDYWSLIQESIRFREFGADDVDMTDWESTTIEDVGISLMLPTTWELDGNILTTTDVFTPDTDFALQIERRDEMPSDELDDDVLCNRRFIELGEAVVVINISAEVCDSESNIPPTITAILDSIDVIE